MFLKGREGAETISALCTLESVNFRVEMFLYVLLENLAILGAGLELTLLTVVKLGQGRVLFCLKVYF